MPKGIPHSKFLSWGEDDQEKALQWTALEQARCPNCGTIPANWLDENGRWVEPSPYVLQVVECTGCKEMDEEKQKAETTGQDLKGVYMSWVPNRE